MLQSRRRSAAGTAKTEIGAVEDSQARRTHGFRQALATKFRCVLQALPPAFGVLPESLLEAGAGGHLAGIPRGGLGVAHDVQLRDGFFTEPRIL